MLRPVRSAAVIAEARPVVQRLARRSRMWWCVRGAVFECGRLGLRDGLAMPTGSTRPAGADRRNRRSAPGSGRNYRDVAGFAGQVPETGLMLVTSNSGRSIRSWPRMLSALFVFALAGG